MDEKIITLNGTEYIVKADNGQSLTPEILANVKNQLMVKMGITSKSESNIVKLGTPTCPSSVTVNTIGTLTASVTQGTAPFTYTWTITKPGGGTDTLPNNPGPHSYTFSLTGTYGINLTVVDSCPSGGLSDNAFCSVKVDPLTGSITFLTPSTPGANIFLDGTLVGITSATISNVTAGSHSYTLSLTGYNNATGTVTVTAGQTSTISVTLTPIVTVGSVGFYSTPSGASVYLDGSFVGTTNVILTDVSAGTHSYKLSLDGHNDYTGSVTAIASQTVTVSVTLTPTPSYANWVISKGGATGLKSNLSALGEIIDGYLGMISLGFTVTLGNVGTTINYYLGV